MPRSVVHGLMPYPAMKDSGVLWLDDIPKHWEVRRLKQSFKRIVGGSTPSSADPRYWDGDVVWITPTDVSKAVRLTNSLRKITQEGLASCSSELVPRGSIIVTSRAPVGNVALAEVELCTNQGCKALIASDVVINPMFGFAVLCILKGEMQSLATGTTFTEISTNKLGVVSIPLPPLHEQSAIVRFLDHADTRINRFIRAKQQLIKLLEEQKQAIIHRAVTRGLDPNVRLKPSGVAWLRDIPEHWDVRRNRQIFTQRNQTGFGELPILEVSLKTGVRIRNFNNTIRKQVLSDRNKYKRAQKGDIAYNMMRMWQGAVGVAPVDGLVSPAYVVARPLAGVDVRYFSNLFRTAAYMSEVDNCSRGIVKDRNRLYWEDFKQIHSPYPPIEEQKRIADAIEKISQGLHYAMDQMNREISLCREYHTRMISDVVTGKLDVREAAANLPEEPNEPEAIEEGNIIMEESIEEDRDAVPEEAEA